MHQNRLKAVRRLILATIIVMAVTVIWAFALYQHLQAYHLGFVGHSEVLMDFQGNGVVYAAFEHKSEIPPAEWFIPEELGIHEIAEYGENGLLRIKCTHSLQEQPIFKYKDKFYWVSPLWAILGLQEPWWTWGNGSTLMGIGMMLILAWIVLVTEWQKALMDKTSLRAHLDAGRTS